MGRLDSNNTLLELLPLPSPKSTDWNYCSFSKLTMLKDRKTYQTFFLDARILKIKDKIKSHKPRVVFFYGFKKYKNELRKFLNVEFSPNKESLDFYHGHVDDTLLLFTNHPTAPGLPSKYFEQIATIARDGIA